MPRPLRPIWQWPGMKCRVVRLGGRESRDFGGMTGFCVGQPTQSSRKRREIHLSDALAAGVNPAGFVRDLPQRTRTLSFQVLGDTLVTPAPLPAHRPHG